MRRRFTDIEKWDDEWFLDLSNDHKVIFQFLCDKCSLAGRWKKNLGLLNFSCKVNMTYEQLEQVFKDRIYDYNKFYFMPRFLTIQYPKGLNSEKPIIIAARNELEQFGLSDFVRQLYGEEYLTKEHIKKLKQNHKKEKSLLKEKQQEEIINIATLILKKSFIDTKKQIYPMLNIEGEIRACVNWYTNKGKKPNWERAITNWLKIAYEKIGIVAENKPQKDNKPIILLKPDPKQQEEVAKLTKRTVENMNKK